MNLHHIRIKGLLLFLLALPFSIYITKAQTTTQNYVRTRVPNREITTNTKLDALSSNKDSVQTVIQYMDGLGRPLQTVQRQSSPTSKDIVQHFVYDQYGREAVKYLPYATTATGDASYKTDALSAGLGIAKFYHPAGSTGTQQTNGIPNTTFPFAQTGFEASPLNRVVEQGAQGAGWQLGATPDANSSNHSARVVYTTNDQTAFTSATANNTGSRKVMIYRAIINSNQSRTLSRGVGATVEYYTNGQLTVTITRNENWQPSDGCFGTTEEYKDKEGRVIVRRSYNLKKTYSAGVETKTAEMLSTYYVYDDLGNLCFVLPPAAGPDVVSSAQTQTTIDYRCYQYRYDALNRLVQKKTPSKGWEYIIYNMLDLPVATQDSVQRMKSPQEWTITKYDPIERPVIIGIYQYPGTTAGTDYHAAIQSLADAQTAQWETPMTTGNGYTNNTWPTAWTTTLSVNYYDGYTGIPGFPGNYDLHMVTGYSTRVRGLLTASKVLVLNTPGDYLWKVPYYDDEGKVIRTFSQHYVGGASALSLYNYDDVSTTYNFLKLPTFVSRRHYLKNAAGTAGTLTLTDNNSYNYDHMGRKLTDNNQMRDGSNTTQATVLLSRTDYNEVGQLKLKRLHSINSGANYLQIIDYRYNPRGWLTNINNSNLTNDGGLTSNDANDKFGEDLSYDGSTTATPQYNGNIATVQWKSAPYTAGSSPVTPVKQTYDYGYDNLNRLTAAVSSTNTSNPKDNFYGENVTYDNMGNISSLGRYDNIGNARTQIDTLTYTYSFYRLNQVDDGSPYTGTAGFTELVKQINEYTYDGNGNQLRDQNKGISSISYNLLNLPQTITKNDGSTVVYVYSASGNKLRKLYTAGGTTTTTEYDNGIQYDNSTTNVSFIQTEEGRARHSGTTYTYEYDLKDHLGNTRITLTPDPVDLTQQTSKILQENDYYPFGYGIQSMQVVVPSPKNEYLYNHKELQEETGLYDYGARFYDPVIGRWNSVDPLAEKMRRFSPYNYGDDNPIRNIDPDGRITTNFKGPLLDPGADAEAKIETMEKILRRADLSDTYFVNKNGRLETRKPSNIPLLLRYLSKFTSTAALVFWPLETSDHDDIPFEKTQNYYDDQEEQKEYNNDPKVATEEDNSGRKYLTYTKTKENDDGTITIYSGRTSGNANESDKAILTRRDATHHMAGYGPAVIDKSSKNRFAIRGREQQLIDFFGKSQSDGGSSGNRIRGVSKLNPLGRIYHNAASLEFQGELYKYTGH
jgi:RHS repeat-associated protein